MTPNEPGRDEINKIVAATLLRPLPDGAYEQLARYVQLLYRWNERMNLTAIREPAVMVGLHIAECLLAAQLVPTEVATVLDFGSGAGLPGIPMQIARPELAVTLAESQLKKAGFLREALRELPLDNARIASGRVEDMPGGRVFDLVTMRAVDQMDRALPAAGHRVRAGGYCMVLTSVMEIEQVTNALPDFRWKATPVQKTDQRIILLGRK